MHHYSYLVQGVEVVLKTGEFVRLLLDVPLQANHVDVLLDYDSLVARQLLLYPH